MTWFADELGVKVDYMKIFDVIMSLGRKEMDNKRWYDKEPTLSLAVSLVQNSRIDVQAKCAEYIKNRAQDFGVVLSGNLLGAFNYVVNRWYDSSDQLKEAFDYLKEADDVTRKQIAIEVINFLENTEKK